MLLTGKSANGDEFNHDHLVLVLQCQESFQTPFGRGWDADWFARVTRCIFGGVGGYFRNMPTARGESVEVEGKKLQAHRKDQEPSVWGQTISTETFITMRPAVVGAWSVRPAWWMDLTDLALLLGKKEKEIIKRSRCEFCHGRQQQINQSRYIYQNIYICKMPENSGFAAPFLRLFWNRRQNVEGGWSYLVSTCQLTSCFFEPVR